MRRGGKSCPAHLGGRDNRTEAGVVRHSNLVGLVKGDVKVHAHQDILAREVDLGSEALDVELVQGSGGRVEGALGGAAEYGRGEGTHHLRGEREEREGHGNGRRVSVSRWSVWAE